ncbi:YceI family protein [Mangrovimonas sp. YM274]|uniref:YceI family protein n=1 Tax=Mangrovimonas sp. YM274 TaxID=3070660 RepID=UPI0027DD17FE|nr:YceI family protein [Mangrovimonas sp. YM274]WMI68513.1 YceI family protein [Mangrovimonas sp. YM274]
MRLCVKTLRVVFIGFLIFGSYVMKSQTYAVTNGTAFFKAKISINSYSGESKELKGHLDVDTGEFEFHVPVSSIDTGINKRNEHMFELLKSKEYTYVRFEGVLEQPLDVESLGAQTITARGTFTLAGSSKEVAIPLEFSKEMDGLRLKASWKLLITDYNLEPPTKALFRVKDEHEMEVEALLRED